MRRFFIAMPIVYNHWEEACKAYVLEECTQVEAYLRGFPKQKNAKKTTLAVAACKFFKRPKVAARLEELRALKQKVAEEQFMVDAKYVLKRLVDVDQMDVADILDEDGTLRPLSEWPKIWRQFVSQLEIEEVFAGRGDERDRVGLLKKIKWPDKLRNLEMLGKHINVSAFKDVTEHTGPGGGPLQLINATMTPQEAAEAYRATLRSTGEG